MGNAKRRTRSVLPFHAVVDNDMIWVKYILRLWSLPLHIWLYSVPAEKNITITLYID